MSSVEVWRSMDTRQSADRRQGCCWDGKYFFDALKAIVTRLMFLAHALLAVWRLVQTTGNVFWLFAVSYVGLLVETVVILFKRRGQEWSW
jgi:hypothetical protein